MSRARVAVCADDAGLAASSDDAILRCCTEGVVRAVSVVAAGPTAERFLERVDPARIDVGLHLNLTEGRALAGAAKTLTDADGVFLRDKEAFWRDAQAIDAQAIAREVAAQWAWLAARIEPAFLNGHNHVHVFSRVHAALPETCPYVRVPADPGLDQAVVARAADADPCFTGHAFGEKPTVEVFLRSLSGSRTEFMVHPGARPGSPFTEARERDLEAEVLCSGALREALGAAGVDWVGIGNLA